MKNIRMTMRFSNTTEGMKQLDLIRKWSEMVPEMIFLDLCTVSHIKDAEKSDQTSNPQIKETVRRLREIDKEKNKISYFLALMERASDQNKGLPADELVTQATRDFLVVKRFFQNAKMAESEEFIASYVVDLNGMHTEVAGNNYHSFLNFINAIKLYNPLAPKEKIHTAAKICDEAKRLSIDRQHPVVLTALACVYGCLPAKKVLKLSSNSEKFSASNALGDIQAIQRINLLASGLPPMRTRFITADSYLEDYCKFFELNAVDSTSTEEGMTTKYNISVKGELLFPDLYSSAEELLEESVVQQKAEERAQLGKLIGVEF